MLVAIAGQRWYAAPSLSQVQAEVVHHATVQRRGARHAALAGEFAALRIRAEAKRQAALAGAGVVEVLHILLPEKPYEVIPPRHYGHLRQFAAGIAERLRRFIEGTQLSARLELDTTNRRLRVTIELRGDAPVSRVLDSGRLSWMTPTEVAAALRSGAQLGPWG